jgi:hypothetical protein
MAARFLASKKHTRKKPVVDQFELIKRVERQGLGLFGIRKQGDDPLTHLSNRRSDEKE